VLPAWYLARYGTGLVRHPAAGFGVHGAAIGLTAGRCTRRGELESGWKVGWRGSVALERQSA
jgi:hypothetical protein